MSRTRAALVDVAVVLLLMALTLSILDDTFADRGYLVAGLVPVALMLGLALLAREWHEGVWWYALLAVGLFAPLGALVGLQRPGPWIVPTLETMNRVLGEVVGAPVTLVSSVPPVETSGQVMLVPFLVGFLAAVPAAWLAVATRSALAPVAPLVLALAATIPLGVLVPSLLVPRGIAFAIVVVAWAAARARRRESLVGRARGSVPAALTAVLTVALVSAVVTFLVPDDNEVDRVLLRGDDNTLAVSAAADSVVPRRSGGTDQLFKATGVPEGRRIRFAALDHYDGTAWIPATESPGTDGYGTFKRIGREVAPLHDGPTVDVRIQLRPGYTGDWLPMLGELTRIDLDYTDGRSQLDDVRYNQATSSALVVGGVDPRDDYTFTSVLTDGPLSRTDPTREADDEQRQPEGAFLDEYLRPFAREDLPPLARTLLLARYLRLNGAVRLTGTSSQRPVDLGIRMLGSDDMVGTPFQYSALMALSASRLGVPARVVVGAEPRANGVVTHDDVTSWVELQLADGTWRTLGPDRYTGVHDASGDDVDKEDTKAFVVRELKFDKDFTFPKGTFLGLDEDADLGEKDSPATWALGLAVGAVLLGSVLLLGVVIAKRVRRARRRRTSSWSRLHVNGWQEVLDAARDRGTPVPESWGRVSQAGGLGVGLDLARRADAAVFAPGVGPDEEGWAFWQECQALREEVLASADARHRLWAPFNPASLVAGWARGRTGGRSRRQVRHKDRRSRRQHPAGA
ncbi:Transglutaminase-like superfamily protein [Nocardioides exalbidus]|uniref:Transglutaminase-like superfamily protein n=1 Tax=Nocardioides exalbidus TaxID=402596 RepID=A0A1H4XCH1_9ACTN|nr:transglutaminaseTgpA domain-containing protein [Nocardioides exalbidus]SED02598.1 Transglutaminase-like superfamily protein [Nocardioides exalbidus]